VVSTGPERSVAFLLSQLGFVSAGRFAGAVAPLGLEPAEAGLLRQLARREGETQQALASALSTSPSRIVALLDGLAARGLVERRAHPSDRRARAIHLTPDGRALLGRLATAGRRHERAMCEGLSAGEQEELRELLTKLAAARGLVEGVHPGFRDR
jgi:DNA-binding MarR family transcriptional regulator